MTTLATALRRTVLPLALALGATAALSSPASAHTVTSAAFSEYGCKWTKGYAVELESLPIHDEWTGTRLGTVHLLWNSSHGQNCVVTRRTDSLHGGPPGVISASLTVEGERLRQEYGDYSHYAAVVADAAGKCVRYSGYITGPGDWEGAATQIRFGFCG
ncbi:hypothetical protein KIK06_15830 [Nocardiopsis sp. EMB25]|uniref:hypothetical protein n=1 Tax=Nocardiopsis sp. EMB25 TaxID=2835867 RepID=UPI00228402EC|nr:hypothetical protein [Nocardiopsis sp. EMB25]MCY9785354.1 hypothetical protein [Nocardiopsis sp. EMB25]